jgi:type I restriction enzyme R subunit
MPAPEESARQQIDGALSGAGWSVQDIGEANVHAARGVAIREFPLKQGHGFADYLLYVDGKAAGVVEAKKAGTTLTGVETQAAKYSEGLPDALPAHQRPLPFLYQSTGVETRFTNWLDPEPRSRRVFHFHRPETLAAWLAEFPSTLRKRLRDLPPIVEQGLWRAQLRAVRNLEQSFAEDRPRALIQMATGSGKTFTAVTAIYRLIKFAEVPRVLFLVDRSNLGRQTLKEFQQYVTPDDGRKFTELYNVQHLASNCIDPVARVCITTIQRLYSMLKGQPDLDPELEEGSKFDTMADLAREPVPVEYNPAIPVETFGVLFTDECHRSIYDLWRQVLEYFDAFIVGLTATPSKQTFGFFNQNLVMEYKHDEAVADGVNVDFDVYRIRTEITERGSRVEAGHYLDKRDRQTRAVRWQKLEDDLTYDAKVLDREVVAQDQIRTVIRTFRDKLFTEIFPGRKEVPKTLIYAKDDSHADDIVQIVREEFAKGNEFCEKITYRTGTARIVTKEIGPDGQEVERVTYKSTGVKPEDLLSSFRNGYHPRVVVTVDMIATGTDIKPLEIVMFLRAVKSRNFFEQMKGRGVRVINPTDFQAVTPDATGKTHFVIVDCVGQCEQELTDSKPLERKQGVAFDKLIQSVALGSTDPDILSSLASRLVRLERQVGHSDRQALVEAAHGQTLGQIAAGLLAALDPDRHIEAARAAAGQPADAQPTAEQIAQAAEALRQQAAAPFAANLRFRHMLIDMRQRYEQTIDTVSKDAVIEAGYSADARERAGNLVESFEAFLREHKDEITALQVLYSQPYALRLHLADVKDLAAAIRVPLHLHGDDPDGSLGPLWRAYETLEKSKVRGAGGRRLWTDIVSLVRFALHQEVELAPYPERVAARFRDWVAQQEAGGRRFTAEQREWLELIRDHIAANLAIDLDDFDMVPFNQKGGLGKVYALFGEELNPLLDELNEVLAA